MDKKEKWLMKEYIIPFLIMLAITGAGIVAFMFTIGVGENIAPVNTVVDEMTKPTSGRLCYLIFAAIAFLVCAVLAEKFARKDRIYPAFYLGFTAGMILWQCVGEASWHFGYSLEGGYYNYFRIESPGALFLVLAFALFTGYLMKNGLLGFGVLCTLLSFLCNWFGHFVSEGTYPLAAEVFSVGTWYAVSGVVCGVILTAVAIILPIKVYKDTKGRLLCSMLLYIGISVFSFGFIEGFKTRGTEWASPDFIY